MLCFPSPDLCTEHQHQVPYSNITLFISQCFEEIFNCLHHTEAISLHIIEGQLLHWTDEQTQLTRDVRDAAMSDSLLTLSDITM